ncbi:hypothetical protein VTL71DRAFT_16501 [Oculimacula yallundae]|uniref:Uncharacterized protein n=1 Tax=Oculimacula yallundae TaxID=86028 RepID=A0ABR4CEM2_9HELO
MPNTRFWYPDPQSSLYLAISILGNLSILTILHLTHSTRPILLATSLYILILILTYRHSRDSTFQHLLQTRRWNTNDTPASFDVMTVGVMGMLTTAIVSISSVVGAQKHGFESGNWGEGDGEGMLGDVPLAAVFTLGGAILFTLMPAFKGYVFW